MASSSSATGAIAILSRDAFAEDHEGAVAGSSLECDVVRLELLIQEFR
jgi:hypothetical protein